MYFRYRNYSQRSGRFATIDPVGYDYNMEGSLYQFADNMPNMNADPFGLWPELTGGWQIPPIPNPIPQPNPAPPAPLPVPHPIPQPTPPRTPSGCVDPWDGTQHARNLNKYPKKRTREALGFYQVLSQLQLCCENLPCPQDVDKCKDEALRLATEYANSVRILNNSLQLRVMWWAGNFFSHAGYGHGCSDVATDVFFGFSKGNDYFTIRQLTAARFKDYLEHTFLTIDGPGCSFSTEAWERRYPTLTNYDDYDWWHRPFKVDRQNYHNRK